MRDKCLSDLVKIYGFLRRVAIVGTEGGRDYKGSFKYCFKSYIFFVTHTDHSQSFQLKMETTHWWDDKKSLIRFTFYLACWVLV